MRRLYDEYLQQICIYAVSTWISGKFLSSALTMTHLMYINNQEYYLTLFNSAIAKKREKQYQMPKPNDNVTKKNPGHIINLPWYHLIHTRSS